MIATLIASYNGNWDLIHFNKNAINMNMGVNRISLCMIIFFAQWFQKFCVVISKNRIPYRVICDLIYWPDISLVVRHYLDSPSLKRNNVDPSPPETVIREGANINITPFPNYNSCIAGNNNFSSHLIMDVIIINVGIEWSNTLGDGIKPGTLVDVPESLLSLCEDRILAMAQ